MMNLQSPEGIKTISVLIVVDVVGALTSGLGTNVYMVDTNKHLGSGAEGQAELVTVLPAGSRVVWSIAPVDPNTDIDINGFTGQAVTQGVITPQTNADGSWTSLFQPQAAPSGSQFQYSISVIIDGTTVLNFDPFLTVK
jgi:hypothetical protein